MTLLINLLLRQFEFNATVYIYYSSVLSAEYFRGIQGVAVCMCDTFIAFRSIITLSNGDYSGDVSRWPMVTRYMTAFKLETADPGSDGVITLRVKWRLSQLSAVSGWPIVTDTYR